MGKGCIEAGKMPGRNQGTPDGQGGQFAEQNAITAFAMGQMLQWVGVVYIMDRWRPTMVTMFSMAMVGMRAQLRLGQ